MTLLGGPVLMMVSLAEVIFYISALGSNPETMGLISNSVGHAIQHLYFIVAAPAVFLPLGWVLLNSRVLSRAFAVLALLLGATFFVLGVTSLQTLILSPVVTSFAAVQAIWWLSAAISLFLRSGHLTPVAASEL